MKLVSKCSNVSSKTYFNIVRVKQSICIAQIWFQGGWFFVFDSNLDLYDSTCLCIIPLESSVYLYSSLTKLTQLGSPLFIHKLSSLYLSPKMSPLRPTAQGRNWSHLCLIPHLPMFPDTKSCISWIGFIFSIITVPIVTLYYFNIIYEAPFHYT